MPVPCFKSCFRKNGKSLIDSIPIWTLIFWTHAFSKGVSQFVFLKVWKIYHFTWRAYIRAVKYSQCVYWGLFLGLLKKIQQLVTKIIENNTLFTREYSVLQIAFNYFAYKYCSWISCRLMWGSGNVHRDCFLGQ